MVTYRRGVQLRDYFDTLARQTRPLDTLLVVDNDPDGSAQWILAEHGLTATKVDYVLSGENIGPAGGIALGMRRVLEFAADDDWILTLDDDDPPRTPEMLAELVHFGEELAATEPSLGGVGLCGGRFDEQRGRFLPISDAELRGAVPSSWIGGNQLPCYRASAVRAVGVFDERYFINFEELDYGLRLLDRGFTIYAHGDLWRRERDHLRRNDPSLIPSRHVSHSTWRRYYSLRNLLFLLRVRGHRRAVWRLTAVHLLKPVPNLSRSPKTVLHHLHLNARAILDARRGRMGRTVAPAPKPYVRRT